MRYQFPHNISLDEVRSVVDRANARLDGKIFIEADRGDHIIFNYLISVPKAYEGPIERDNHILRELRGLTFHKDGRILARKYHKFFNLGEKDETMPESIDFSNKHLILEKLDGSMCCPVLIGDNVRWTTKMGITDVAIPIEEFVSSRPQYDAMARWCFEHNLTPIFEWVSRKQKIVIDYPVDNLILTAIRDNFSGKYMPY